MTVTTITPQQFQDWLRGFLDRGGAMTPADVEKIRTELARVAAPVSPAQVTGIDWTKIFPAGPPAPQPILQPVPYVPSPTVPYPIIPTYPAQPVIGDPVWPWFGGGTICGGGTVHVGHKQIEVGPTWAVPSSTSTSAQESH